MSGRITGRPLGEAPAVVLLGGITADTHATGPGGWWSTFADALALEERATVLCPELPGYGPPSGAAELADAVAEWLYALDAPPVAFYGASLGGLVGLALAARHPGRVRHLVSISAGLGPDPWGTAVRHLQRRLVRKGEASLARQLGMVTYRGRAEIAARFAPLGPDDAEPEVAAYLDHHGQRFADTFSPDRYLFLSEAIDRTDLRPCLHRVCAQVDVIGVPEDLLFPVSCQRELVEALRSVGVDARMHLLHADTGHDAFLTHQAELASIVGGLQ